MDYPGLNEIKKDLEKRDVNDLRNYCIRLAKFKKENKELLGFMLFEADNMNIYIENVKLETENSFLKINKHNIYFIKKSIRKILKTVNKHIRFSISKQVEVDLLIHFCNCIISHSIPLDHSIQLKNLYNGQLKKIDQALALLHPDLQYDFKRKLL
ncbi:MAG TPA: hypothetical protein VIJ75_14205 [Hanamia sp.]